MKPFPDWLKKVSLVAISLFVPLYIFQIVGLPDIRMGSLAIYAGGDGWLYLLWGGIHFHEADIYLMPINVCLLVAALPLLYAGVRRLRMRPRGYCQNCGYDLRATPDRCPECGTIPPTKKAIAST